MNSTEKNCVYDPNFWGYCKNIFEKNESIQPDFGEATCYRYFRNALCEKDAMHMFEYPFMDEDTQ